MLINNIYTFSCSSRISNIRRQREKTMENVSSGIRINRASDDAAGLAISESFKAQVRGLGQAEKNIQDGISMMQVADGALDDISKHLHRMNELSVNASNGTLTDEDRKLLDDEFQQLKDSISYISESVNFNGIKLFDEDKSLIIQTRDNPYACYDIKLFKMDINSLSLKDDNLLNMEKSKDAISSVKDALNKINDIRIDIGTCINDLCHALGNTNNSNFNISSSMSIIKDTDMALSLMGIVKNDILSRYSEIMYSVSKGSIESVKNFI